MPGLSSAEYRELPPSPPVGGGSRTTLLDNIAVAGVILAVVIAACVLVTWIDHMPKTVDEVAREDRAMKVAVLTEAVSLPVTEASSASSCKARQRDVGACILSERTMRSEAEPLWQQASVERRKACLGEAEGRYERAAFLYACLVQGGP